MSNLKLPTMTFEALSKTLKAGGDRKLAYATVATRSEDGKKIFISQHGNVIATLAPDSVSIDNCGYDTTTTATRLRKILSDNGITYYVRIKQYAMRLYNDSHTELDPCFRSIEFVKIGHAWCPNWETLSDEAPAKAPVPTEAPLVDLFAA